MDSPVQRNWTTSLQPLWALFQWEAWKLTRSWVLRLWLALTALGGIFMAAISAHSSPK